jgi:hypothetical protein
LDSGVRDGAGHQPLELGELDFPANAGSGLAQQQPALIRILALGTQENGGALGCGHKARTEEPGGHRVDPDALDILRRSSWLAGALEEARRPVGRLAHACRLSEQGAACGQRDPRLRPDLAHVECSPRRNTRLVGRGTARGERRDE